MANLRTPIPTDSFSRNFVRMFSDAEFQLAPVGFLALFGDPMASGSETLYSDDAGVVEIDIKKANGQRLAELVHRGTASSPRDADHTVGDEFTTFSRQFPLIETLSPIESGRLLYRRPGEPTDSMMTRLGRNRDLARSLLWDGVMRQLRTMNYLARESILNGVQPAIHGTTNTDLQYDFHRDSNLNITVGTAWDDSSPTIMADIDLACQRLEEIGYAEPNFLGVDSGAWAAAIEDADFQSLSDNRRIELIQVSTNNPVPPEFQRFVDAGWIPRGRLRTLEGRELWVFNYNHTYTPVGGGSPVRYLESGHAFITDIRARRDRYFGPPDRLPITADEAMWYAELFGMDMTMPPMPPNLDGTPGGIVDPTMFHFDGYRSNDRKTVVLRTQSGPIFAPTHTDAIATLDGLLT